ncbi:GDSL esterase/lipase At3g48460-like [Humulus lupulus]|uniref:GDSL esterase/lipase At3g48460-like n=1 Tax=Humulus lupulus TaxID=3486 RepID=UPI002B4128E4|nr:GDSL esterase/lipase At3g48460-like [Humulus lupulus]
MTTPNHLVQFQIALFVILVSFSFTYTHTPPHEASPTPPQQQQSPPSPQQQSPPKSPSQTTVEYKGCWSKVFAFGDSNTDTGNGYLIGGLKSFTSTSFSKSFYSSSSNGYLKGHRLSNGRLIVDHLTESLSCPSLTAYKSSSVNFDYNGSVNFAIAGTSTLSRDYFYNNNIGHTFMWSRVPESYRTEITWFNTYLVERSKRHGSQACRKDMANTLFWVGGVGGNDYLRAYGSSITSRMLTDLSVGHVSKILKTLLDQGALYIVVQGLPPLGCLPSQLSMCPMTDRDEMGCSKATNNLVKVHNKHLQLRLDHFRRRYPYAMIAYADTYGAYEAILANYKAYHFQEPFRACCGSNEGGAYNFDVHCLCGSPGTSTCKNSGQYMSWDGIHFTDSMNGQLTEHFLNKGYCQPSFEELAKKKKMHVE